MRIKTIVAIGAALLPVAYCGYLFFHFLDVGGSAQSAVSTGLGPTLLGLGGIGLLLCVPVVLRILGRAADARAPKPPGGGWDDANFVAESSFDADAALARYLARKQAEPQLPPAAEAPPQPGRDAAGPRPSFGRKIG